MGERSTWKILCDKGKWMGKSVSCEEEDLIPAGLLTNATCSFRNNEANVVSFYNDLEIKEEVVEFPAGAVLVSRCVDIGKYAMIGPKSRKCVGGEWDGSKPSCFGLNQENDYAMEKPPTILFRHQLGPIMQSNDGRLIVYPGTILHMECLWMRKFGNPKWNVSHEYRKYPEGWSSDPGRDSYLEYRISIFHAVQDDSGVFTCITPARQSHQVEILVEAVHCTPLPMRRGLISSSQSTKMGSEVAFSCANGNSLIGAAQITCLPSGNWSAPLPLCESVECGEVALSSSGTPNSRPRVSIVSRGVGGRAAFSCSSGWGLKGPAEIVCSPSGEWTPAPPVCIEVSCPPPAAPVNGYLLGKAPFRAGDIVQFNCNPAHMMQGQPIVACQDNARWSGDTPKCIQACSYPGTTISGRMSSVKFYYKIGETISFTCEPGLVLRGAPMLRCLRNGKWSNAIPICSRDSSGSESNISGNDSEQLLNDAPILSEHHIITNTDNSSPSPLLESTSSSAPMKQQQFYTKSEQLLSFPGFTVNVSDITTPTPTQPLILKKPEMRAKLRKSKTYYKINQDLLASLSSALPTVVGLLKKTTIESAETEQSTMTSNTYTTEATFTFKNTTQPILDTSTNISTDEESFTSVTEAFVEETNEQDSTVATQSVNLEVSTVESVESSYSHEFDDTIDTTLIPTDSVELNFSTSLYSTASNEDLAHSSEENLETTTKKYILKSRKSSLKKMPKNCTEVEEELDSNLESENNNSNINSSSVEPKNTQFSSKSSEGNDLTKEYELLSTAHTPAQNLKTKNKSKVSLDLLSLFQEIDKLENKDNTTMYGRSSSKKKDLSHIEPASNAEIDHIKKQLGIDTNSKRKPINR